MKERLENSHLPYEAKHPIFIVPRCYFTRLVILDAREKVKHMRTKGTLNEVRSRFHISCSKSTVTSVIKGCVTCKYVLATPTVGLPPSDLPEYRVSYEFAFTNVGIDHAGPLFVKDIYSNDSSMYKALVCLLTCAATRSVHIELCPNLSAPGLIRCLKRFIARRGTFKMVIGDNFKYLSARNCSNFWQMMA